MNWRAVSAIFVFLGGTSLSILAVESIAPTNPNEGWKLTKQTGGVTIHSRVRPGSPVKEFKAIGEIDAPTRAVHNVIEDIESYPKFMPYTAECRLLKRDGDSTITYQRLSPKIVDDRDYTLRIRKKSWPVENGLAYTNRWEPANELGPAEKKGVVRVKMCEGGWLLEPVGPGKTRATYTVYTDSGGAIPVFLANSMSQMGIGRLFAAIRKQVRDQKYHAE